MTTAKAIFLGTAISYLVPGIYGFG